jgi:hypothetical protein
MKTLNVHDLHRHRLYAGAFLLRRDIADITIISRARAVLYMIVPCTATPVDDYLIARILLAMFVGCDAPFFGREYTCAHT